MKKGRPAICLSVLCDAQTKDDLVNLVLNESSTIGLRVLPFEKHVLPRQQLDVETSLGTVSVKQVTQPDGRLRHKVEHDEVQRVAGEHGLDYQAAKHKLEFEVTSSLA